MNEPFQETFPKSQPQNRSVKDNYLWRNSIWNGLAIEPKYTGFRPDGATSSSTRLDLGEILNHDLA